MTPRKFVEIMTSFAGIDQIIGHHGVERSATQLNTGGAEHHHVVLDVLPHFGNRRIFQHGPKEIRNRCRIETERLLIFRRTNW